MIVLCCVLTLRESFYSYKTCMKQLSLAIDYMWNLIQLLSSGDLPTGKIAQSLGKINYALFWRALNKRCPQYLSPQGIIAFSTNQDVLNLSFIFDFQNTHTTFPIFHSMPLSEVTVYKEERKFLTRKYL